MVPAEKVSVWPVLQYLREYLAELDAYVQELTDDLDLDEKTVVVIAAETVGDLTDVLFAFRAAKLSEKNKESRVVECVSKTA